jgi:hypothetical protein
LKTAPVTGQDAPPRRAKRVIKAKRFDKILSSFRAPVLNIFPPQRLLDRQNRACYSFYFEMGAIFRSIRLLKQSFYS